MAVSQPNRQALSPISWTESLGSWLERGGTVLVLLLLLIIFSLSAENFLKVQNLQNILRQIAITAIIGVGMTLVILIGGIDLSVGSVVLFSAAVMNSLIFNQVLPAIPAILVGLLAAALVGLINGWFVERVGISPVIVTLGTMIAVRGLGQMILWINNSWLWVRDPIFYYIKTTSWLAIPIPAVIMIVLYVIASIAMKQTVFGRHIYGIGGNERAARLCGIATQREKIWVYVICALCAGIGGILMGARLGAISPGVGQGMEFEAITAVILGGTRLSGGVGRVERTLLGAIIVGMILNYMTIMGISAHYQRAVTGFIILGAALLDQLSRTRSNK
ncbi:MAG TPA: ABC transporter permease [Anaerolineales bacterium]|nr:ABC transporter permease [Anaerolineales bacterium]